ncbi:MAG: TonB-dependent receptor plug domain-containing protein, partial [Proteobacteria bacterium]|nr:TonB-dependent receptor plug domain-containing protein [Pseudomonadota bacterium]
MNTNRVSAEASAHFSINRTRQPIVIAAGLLLGSLCVFPTASAQDTSVIEEIVVTAQKRGVQSIQEIPMSISALSGDRLIDMGATSFMDYAAVVPGIQFQDLGPGDKEYIIRGANSSGGSTAAVYFDEAIITGRNKEDGGGRQPDIKLYDMERIEILKGPQGTLYGASAFSGTIRMITNKPDPSELAGYVEAEVSSTHKGGENYNFNGWVNLPIIEDKLAVRA